MRWLVVLPVVLLPLACDGGSAPATTPDAKATPTAAAKTESPAAPRAEAAPQPGPAPAAPDVAPQSQAEVGSAAPTFELPDLEGKRHALTDYRGKVVVLEWFNPECPFVKYAHGEGPLSDMAAREVGQGVVWLAINSGAPGKQGHGVEANEAGVEKFSMAHPVLLDPDGAVGHHYGALKTPHMFVIDAQGVLRYAGAIDNAPFGEVDGGGEKVNYVAAALAAIREGRDVATPQSDPYGCSVKYGSKS